MGHMTSRADVLSAPSYLRLHTTLVSFLVAGIVVMLAVLLCRSLLSDRVWAIELDLAGISLALLAVSDVFMAERIFSHRELVMLDETDLRAVVKVGETDEFRVISLRQWWRRAMLVAIVAGLVSSAPLVIHVLRYQGIIHL